MENGIVFIELKGSVLISNVFLPDFEDMKNALDNAGRDIGIHTEFYQPLGVFSLYLQKEIHANAQGIEPLPKDYISNHQLLDILSMAFNSTDDLGKVCCVVLIKDILDNDKEVSARKKEFDSLVEELNAYLPLLSSNETSDDSDH
ncbi:Ankyrin repeat-containing protein [Sodalis praecaptivus]|uniref:Ankyrin repeat-containing protein n=2 Tax=Bruguierivoracaceae TaxID=2812006 RepID=W0I099_9GAMM|nr:Ankyrin repeat-containing protein [Sodalis praecaptivus]